MEYREALKTMGLLEEKHIDSDVIKKRYRSLIKRVHPDLMGQNSKQGEISLAELEYYSKRLNIAYEVLKSTPYKSDIKSQSNSQEETLVFNIALKTLLDCYEDKSNELEDLEGHKINKKVVMSNLMNIAVDVFLTLTGASKVVKMEKKVRLFFRFDGYSKVIREYEIKIPVEWKEDLGEGEKGENLGNITSAGENGASILEVAICDKVMKIDLNKLPTRLTFSFRFGAIKINLLFRWQD